MLSTVSQFFIAVGIIVVYAIIVVLSLSYNKVPGDPIDPLYSVSQWNPNSIELTGDCTVPSFPGNCIIEGEELATQPATHECIAPNGESCIETSSGDLVKGVVNFTALCSAIPYCGWARCLVSFGTPSTTSGGVLYLKVTFVSNNKVQITIVEETDNPSYFYVERFSVGNTGLTQDANGALARYYIKSTIDSSVWVLSYKNGTPIPGTQEPVTTLGLNSKDDTSGNFVTFFVLMEDMPTSISPVGPVVETIMPRKILAFGGVTRSTDPIQDELKDFNTKVQRNFWNAAEKYFLVIFNWNTNPGYQAGFYAGVESRYVQVLNNGPQADGGKVFNLSQNFVESRLLGEVGGKNAAFYRWLNAS